MYDISLATNDKGIWLIENTDQGTIQLGHITWETVAKYLDEVRNLKEVDDKNNAEYGTDGYD